MTARACRSDQAGSGSGVWCVRPQGGGGRHGGAMPTDDNAAGVRAGDREPGKIRTTDPRSCLRTGAVRPRGGAHGVRCVRSQDGGSHPYRAYSGESDNAASGRARRREPDASSKTGPSGRRPGSPGAP
ncbi:hypothetical protein EW053_24820 [Streptomyces sp. IB2014 016-6]|nr:hypothetical protein EW053_24820 [Streptomyces sp. IB2014 016-6]